MMGSKKLRDIRRELATIMAQLPAESARQWFDEKIRAASGQPGRDLETLEMIKAELGRAVKKRRATAKAQAVH